MISSSPDLRSAPSPDSFHTCSAPTTLRKLSLTVLLPRTELFDRSATIYQNTRLITFHSVTAKWYGIEYDVHCYVSYSMDCSPIPALFAPAALRFPTPAHRFAPALLELGQNCFLLLFPVWGRTSIISFEFNKFFIVMFIMILLYVYARSKN